MLNAVFVYGTLMPGGTNHTCIADLVETAEPAELTADLYDLGPYPAVIEGSGRTQGWLLRLQDMPEALRRMDQLEDYYGPDHPDNEYERKRVSVCTAQGEIREAYCYYYARVGELRSSAVPLPGGIWPPRVKAPDSPSSPHPE